MATFLSVRNSAERENSREAGRDWVLLCIVGSLDFTAAETFCLT